MCEHYERYLEFIEFLNSNSIDCYTYNHRGHGKDFSVANQGRALPGKGYDTYVMDVIRISKYIREHKRTNSFFLYGHSFGSIVARVVIQKDSNYSGIIASSTTYFSPIIANIYAFVGKTSCLCGKYKRSPFFAGLIFGNKKYQSFEGRTYFDWLSSDSTVIANYMNDQYCGYTYAKGFYKDLAVLNKRASNLFKMKKTKKSLPILLLSGDNDPVTNFSKAVVSIERIYNKLNFTNVSSHIYSGSRHEILHDKSKENVMSDILDFITSNS
jgi:alpha-beta hydrolase superfamily lysophospholipase